MFQHLLRANIGQYAIGVFCLAQTAEENRQEMVEIQLQNYSGYIQISCVRVMRIAEQFANPPCQYRFSTALYYVRYEKFEPASLLFHNNWGEIV